MPATLNKSTTILIDNFIGTYFSNFSNENREQIKESVVDIADSLLEQSNKEVNNLATKSDVSYLREETKKDIANLREETKKDIANLREETKKDIAELKTDISKLHNKIIESKYDLLKWIVTAQLAISGLMLAMIKMT
ncbi:hypothetical protein [Helicobacter sp. MIT 01-3238]|uniref:hypothetical protein n=1 Tax=Helicobacter sp. MIT 01-3238 TaxID=398627 RepID=UPI000E1EE84E|nr:hypothetical protein [Helicobacter sp. MIT 01-3238]RDU52898.1 hypothetical protein CQA40_06240 [Helicobacter sp. MIT 01-3238]